MRPGQLLLLGIAAAAVGLMALVVLGVGVAVAIRYARPTPPGFRDYVKNPELWHELEEEQSEVESSLEKAQMWNDQQIEAAVRRFVFEDGSRQERQVLASLGPKTNAVLLKLLDDKSVRSKLLTGTELPFNQICKLLGENPSADAVPLLAPFLEAKSKEIRKEAALVMGSIGTDSIIPSVRKALRDSDEYVRSYALMGMERASQDNRLSDACRKELFPDVQRLISDGKNTDHARLLLEMNQDQATEFFLSEDIFTPESKSLHDALRALNQKGISIPRDRLIRLIQRLELITLNYPHDYQLGEALHSLGKHKNTDDRAMLERYLSHSEDRVVAGASDGMIASHGLDGFQDRIWNAEGPASLTPPQRHYWAVMALDGEVRNGGFSQYFFNSSGNEWKAALAGLEVMESKERLALLREALAKFDNATPSESRNERMEQLSIIENGKDSVFNELETRYYKSPENLEVMTMRYVLKNADAFK